MNLTEAPSWLELPEEEKINHTYWTCMGKTIGLDTAPKGERWSNLFHSKEEAEAHACIPSDIWIWDREPAMPTSLSETLSEARYKGYRGINILGYKDGKWVVLKEYPVEVPLDEKENQS